MIGTALFILPEAVFYIESHFFLLALLICCSIIYWCRKQSLRGFAGNA
jgi:hypothetical protein